MANIKITQLPTATSIGDNDLIPIVTGIGGTPITEHISRYNFVADIAASPLNTNPVEHEYSDISAMLADQGNQTTNFFNYVVDASADPNVVSGDAYYEKQSLSTTTLATDYRLLSDTETTVVTDSNSYRVFRISDVQDDASPLTSVNGGRIGFEYNTGSGFVTGILFDKIYTDTILKYYGVDVNIKFYNRTTKEYQYTAITSTDWTTVNTDYYHVAVTDNNILASALSTNNRIELFIDKKDAVGVVGDMLKTAYDPANINQQVVGTTATQTLTNKTITAPLGIVTNDVTVSTDKNYVTDAEKIDIITNTAKVSNATHTGEVTGSGALTVDPTAISNKPLVTAVATDTVLLLDATDGALKQADVSDFLAGGGGDMLAANNLSDVANASTSRTNLGVAIGSDVQAWSAVLDATTASFLTADETKLDGIEAGAEVNTINSDVTGEPTGSDVVSNVVSLTQAEYDAGTPVASTFYVITDAVETVVFNMACSDETSDLAVGTSVYTFRMPFAMTLTGVKASVNTAPTGATITVDINESATSVLSTKLTIDATEKTSTTATTPAVISDSALADDAEITIDIDQVGSTITGAGLKVTLYGTTV